MTVAYIKRILWEKYGMKDTVLVWWSLSWHEIWVSRSCVAQGTRLLRSYTLQVLGLPDPKDEGTAILWSAVNCSSKATASDPISLASLFMFLANTIQISIVYSSQISQIWSSDYLKKTELLYCDGESIWDCKNNVQGLTDYKQSLICYTRSLFYLTTISFHFLSAVLDQYYTMLSISWCNQQIRFTEFVSFMKIHCILTQQTAEHDFTSFLQLTSAV